jgi:excisionase family DNA binding protein
MLLTVAELEADSKISRYTWRAWIRQGLIPVTRLGRRVRVAEEDYKRFVENRRHFARQAAAH